MWIIKHHLQPLQKLNLDFGVYVLKNHMARLLHLPKFVNSILREDLTTELHLLPLLCLDMAHESKHSDLISCSRAKHKQSLLQAWTGPEGSRRWSSYTHEGGKVASLLHWLPLPHIKYCWYSFLSEAELTPEQYFGWKDYVNEKFQWHNRESNLPPSSL